MQCRLNGGLAARGYYKLHGLYGDPGVVLNTALVSTVEFNRESFIGNVHLGKLAIKWWQGVRVLYKAGGMLLSQRA
jgi:hypothetical protein